MNLTSKRTRALLVSIVLLAFLALNSAFRIPAAFAPHDFGQFTRTAQLSSGAGAIIGAVVWLGLAIAQWKKCGSWGRGIGIYALVVLGLQSFLLYGAIHGGRIAPDASALARYLLFTVGLLLALSLSSFISHAQFRKQT